MLRLGGSGLSGLLFSSTEHQRGDERGQGASSESPRFPSSSDRPRFPPEDGLVHRPEEREWPGLLCSPFGLDVLLQFDHRSVTVGSPNPPSPKALAAAWM
jgi:hypothetical protein